MFMVL